MLPSFAAPRARFAWRLSGFVTISREYCRLVFSENVSARHLWDKLGFKALRTIPGAVRKNDGSHQDAIMMFRSLIEM
jgi:hypothetical protein